MQSFEETAKAIRFLEGLQTNSKKNSKSINTDSKSDQDNSCEDKRRVSSTSILKDEYQRNQIANISYSATQNKKFAS